MCKLVGSIKTKIGDIPQYILCADYIEARDNRDKWLNRLREAEYYLEKASQKYHDLQTTHCPLDNAKTRH